MPADAPAQTDRWSESTEPKREITVLVVDDEPSNVTSLRKIFEREGMRVLTAESAKDALEVARKHRIEVVLTDLMMPGSNGVELLRAVKEVAPDTEIVLMTAYGTVETAVQAMREGAYDFVEKPLKRMSIVKSVQKAAERQSLVAENRSLKQELKLLTNRNIVGQSQALRRVLDVATQAAPSTGDGVAHPRRKRNGQKSSSREVHPLEEWPRIGAVRRGELRGDPGNDSRSRALRSRARRVHRRRGAS